MKKITLIFMLLFVALFSINEVVAQTTVTIGTGTSSSSTRGPVQISGGTSTTQYSRFVQIYTAAELAATGMTAGNSITEVLWEIASDNVIASGTGTFKVYVKNSTATVATADTWVNLTAGSTLAVDNVYDVNNNFPGMDGWMPFTFMAPFTYTGGALEVAVDWGFSIPTGTGFTSTDGNGIKWRWEAISSNLVVKKTSSSSPSTNITDLKSERANIQIVYNAATCPIPAGLNTANIATSGADLSWTATTATTYNWKVVATGAGSSGTAIDGGATSNTTVTTTSLSPLTTYDFYVESDCGVNGLSGFGNPITFTTLGTAQTTVTIGTGTSSSSTRGPVQISGGTSSTQYSRFVQIYTAAELAAGGMTAGNSITEVLWEIASDNIIASGTGTFKVYVKNSAATIATADTWANLTAGSTLAVDNVYDVNNNFPGTNGWMPFSFMAPFVYTGGALEVAVDWGFSIPTGTGFTNTDGDGIKWRWEAISSNLVVKKTSSSSPSTNITDLKSERANIQIVYSSISVAPDPFDLLAPANNAFVYVAGPAQTPINISWESAGTNAVAYEWRATATGGSLNTPAAVLPSDNMGMDTTLSLDVQAVDALLASLGAAIGDTVVLDWTVVAYDATGDSLFATTPYTISLLRLGVSTPLLLNAPQTTGATTGLRAPNGSASHTFLRAATIVLPSEFATAGISANTTIRNFGFNTSVPIPAGAVTGIFRLYLQNTSDASYLKGTAWSGIQPGMTEVFNDTITINGGGSAWDVVLDTLFDYAGNAVYVAYDWEIIANPLATAISYLANTAVTGALVSASSTTAAPVTLAGSSFRPEFSWGIDKSADDLALTNLYAMGKNPLTYSTAEQIEVTVTNNGYLPADKIVTLDITGANTFTTTETVSLLPGASTVVTFNAFTATTAGINDMNVSVPADQNTANDVQTWVQESTTDTYAYADSVLTGLGGVGYNTGSGLLLNRYYVNGTGAVNQVNIRIADNAATVGNAVYAVLMDTSGAIVSQSMPYTVTAADLDTWVTFILQTSVTLSNVDFFVGLAQPANATGYFPIAFQSEAPTRANAYFGSDLNGANLGAVNGFRLMIEAVISQVCFVTTATTETNVTCNGGTDGSIDLMLTGGSGAATYAWSNGDATEDISGLAAGTYSVTITDNPCVIIETVTITEPAALMPMSSITNITCNGENDGAIDLTVTGGTPTFTFLWDNGETTEDITGLTDGTYIVTITDANGCSDTESITLVEPAVLTLTTSSIADTLSGGIGSAMVMVTGGTSPYTYEWDGTAGAADLTGLTIGTYVASVTDANGCSDTASVFVDNVVSTSGISKLTNLSITPNPTNGNVMIDLELSQNAAISISIYTITGVLLQEFSQENTNQQRQLVDLSNQSNGIYLVRFVIDNQVITKKLVLSK